MKSASFAERTGAEIMGRGRPMPNATADEISIVNFGMGSANAATVMDLLSARAPKAVLLLGKCGGAQLLDGHGLHDQPACLGARRRFKDYLRRTRAMAIDLETATIFAAGLANRIPTGALMLVSDQPMVPEGVKTEASDRKVTDSYVQRHIDISGSRRCG